MTVLGLALFSWMWLFRPRLCLGFGKPALDEIVPLLDKPLLCVSDKVAELRFRLDCAFPFFS